MKNLVMQSGDNLTVNAPRNVASGDGVKVGLIFGIASTTALNGKPVAISCEGVYNIAKHAGDTFAVGDAVYWDDTAHNATSTATANTKIGVATAAAAGPDANVQTRLNESF
jgi:predicted RecA/RadA family phage recombinase